jgi:hypothetical protein
MVLTENHKQIRAILATGEAKSLMGSVQVAITPLHQALHLIDGTSARALSAILTLVERKGREGQAIGATEALTNGIDEIHQNDRQKDPRHRGVAGRSVARPILDLSSHFRGPVFQNLGRPGDENV